MSWASLRRRCGRTSRSSTFREATCTTTRPAFAGSPSTCSARSSDDELAARAGVDARLGPALRGARDLVEARTIAEQLTGAPQAPPTSSPETLRRFRELREGTPGDLDKDAAKAIVRELKAVGGDLRALRLALTGAERGPELWAVLVALPREEALARTG